ncbi:hypothetical protein LTR94_033964, partial [Friedmanniomyces endolithicus]
MNLVIALATRNHIVADKIHALGAAEDAVAARAAGDHVVASTAPDFACDFTVTAIVIIAFAQIDIADDLALIADLVVAGARVDRNLRIGGDGAAVDDEVVKIANEADGIAKFGRD